MCLSASGLTGVNEDTNYNKLFWIHQGYKVFVNTNWRANNPTYDANTNVVGTA